jgi:hypothetical protein
MSKTRKFLTTLTMAAVATTVSLSTVSSAQAHSAPWIAPHLHAIPGPGPIYTGPLFPGPLAPVPPAPPVHDHSSHHNGGLNRGEAAALGVLGGVIIGGVLANANRRQAQPAPAPAAGLPAAHYAYCDAKYRSYVISTNTFTGYDGRQHYCNSPYI